MRILALPLLALAGLLAAPALPAQNILADGDFESHLLTGCKYDLSNYTFSQCFVYVEGFGNAGELDLLDNGGGSCGPGLPAFSGDTQIGLRCRNHSVDSDAFSIQSGGLVQGEVYRLTFWSHAVLAPGYATETGDVEIGISSSSFQFGTQIFFTAPSVNSWTLSSYVFVAPVAGAFYLTVRQEANTDSYNHVDGFALERLPTLAITGTCPGTMTATVSNVTPGGPVGFALAPAAGTFVIPSQYPCAGTLLGLAPHAIRLVATVIANGSGIATLSGPVPPRVCGFSIQAVDLASCETTLVKTL